MSKGKSLWIIPVIVALIVAVAGVFPLSPMPGADQGKVAFAAGPDKDQATGQIVESNAEEQSRGETWHWIISSEQEEMANEILE